VGAVVFDEFHERSLHVDLALALVRRVQQEARPDLRIVVMSATLRAARIAAWLGGAPVISSQGRLFRSTCATSTASPIVSWTRGRRRRRARTGDTDGDVLAFLPAWGDPAHARRARGARAAPRRAAARAVRRPARRGAGRGAAPGPKRKVIWPRTWPRLGDVEGVAAVVDSGLARRSRFDAGVGLDRLELVRISRSSADQRAGRAGRTRAGTCLRLWTEGTQRSMQDEDEPEIRRVDLAGPCCSSSRSASATRARSRGSRRRPKPRWRARCPCSSVSVRSTRAGSRSPAVCWLDSAHTPVGAAAWSRVIARARSTRRWRRPCCRSAIRSCARRRKRGARRSDSDVVDACAACAPSRAADRPPSAPAS
jgi:hypothetical protein